MSLNNTCVLGRLVDAPITIPSQFPGCKFRIASNYRYKTKNGETKEETLYLECTVWGKKVEGVMNLQKGTEIFVSGRLKSSKFTDKTGQERMKIELTVEDIIFQDKLSPESNLPIQMAMSEKQPSRQQNYPEKQTYAKQQTQQPLSFDDYEELPF